MTRFSDRVGLWSDPDDIRAYRNEVQKLLDAATTASIPMNTLQAEQLRAEVARCDRLLERRSKISVSETGRLSWNSPNDA